MRNPLFKFQRPIAAGLLATLAGWFLWQVALAQSAPSPDTQHSALSSDAERSRSTQHSPYPALDNLPSAHTQHFDAASPQRGFAVNPGTTGLSLPAPAHHAGLTFAILGDLSPTNEASPKYLAQAVRELNLLKPDLVLTVGNLIDGLARNPSDYIHQAAATHDALDALKMPWYPCAGDRDILPGTLDPADHRAEKLFETYFGPRYYSLDCGDVHVLVLDTEELLPLPNTAVPTPAQQLASRGISAEQTAWIKADLARTFELRRATNVIVIAHRPLWREADSSWTGIHDLLVDFNHKPIVAVEGPGDAAAALKGPKVVGVFAGAQRAYSHDPTRDGIPYYDLGASAAALEQDAAATLRHYTLLRFDAAAAAPQIALVQMGAAASANGNILDADYFLLDERETISRLAALDEKSINIEGVIEQPLGKDVGVAGDNGPMNIVLTNPLTVPIDIEIRLASTRNLATPTLRENANPYVENFDSAWELLLTHANRHLEPGTHEHWSGGLFCKQQTGEIPPPQVEFLIHWNDARGRTHTVILKRRIPVIPSAVISTVKSVKLEGDDGWRDAYRGGAYSWTPAPDERQKRNPDWDMIADEKNIYLRIRADDDHQTAPPALPSLESLSADAVTIAWAPTADAAPATIQRIVAFPFAAPGHQLFTTNGVGPAQTPLIPLDLKAHPVQLHLTRREDAWELTLAIPRATLFPAGQTSCAMNILVHDNDGTPETFIRSWAKEDPAPTLWGRLTLKPPAAKDAPK